MTTVLILHMIPMNDCRMQKLREALPDAEIIHLEAKATPEQLGAADFILGNVEPGALSHCGRLQMMQLHSAGNEAYLGGTVPAGVKIANASGAYGITISEHMLGMLLSLMRRFPAYHRNQQEERWHWEGDMRCVYGSTVLCLGLGDIGGQFARRAKAMGAATIGVRRAGTDKPDFLDELHTIDQLDTLLPRADVVAISLPATAATVGIMSRERIDRMKPGAYLLNVGRGSAVDQEALCDALEAGRLAGAGLDVTDPEPLPAGHRLWKAPGLLLTPHASGGFGVPQTVDTIVELAAFNFAACLRGAPLRNLVDFETGYRSLTR